MVLEGRAYVSERFAGRDLMRTAKNQHFLAFLSTMHRPCPNSAYNFYQASTGRVMGLSRKHDDGSHFLPPLVMAKRDGYDMLGLLVPKLLAFDAGCSKLICDGAHEVALDYS